MAFQLQLRLLLWKNFTLKRRNKLVVLLELVVPLVLFFILLILRKHQPAEKEPISRFHAWPLPSSGFVALAEAFCDGGIADANGFLQYPKSKTKEFLTVLNRIAQRRGDFMSAFSPQDLSEMPEIYRNLTEDLSAAQKSATPKNFTVSSLFKDRRPIENMMENRFSTSKNETDQLLDSRLFGAQILAALLRHSSRKKAPKPDDSAGCLGLTEESCPEESSIPLGIASEDPEFIALMLSLLNPDPESVAELLVDTLLTPPRIRLLLCDNSPASTQDALYLNISTRICNSSDEDLSALTRTIKENLNYTQVANVTNLDKINYTTFIPRLKLFVSNLKKYSIFRASLRDFAKMARFLPHNDCHNGYDDDDVILGNSTMNGTNNSGVLGAVKLWNALQKVICGSEKVIDEKAVAKPSGDSLNFDALGLTDNQMEHFRFMVRLFMSNPVVLYAPVNTSADRIIQKANSTLQLIDSLNDYARVLMNVTKSMHAYLRLNSTEKQLADLREIQNDMKNGSVVEELMGGAPVIEDFVSKAEEVPRTEELLEELDVTHNAACSWFDALNHTQLNVFRGFENETTLVDYFLTRAYWDNVTVFASVIFDVTDDSMPNHMVYTIRQNASYTTTTQGVRSLFWYPGPRSWDYSYYTFGYLWLQDTLERAMIDLYSEKDIIEPGSFVHQFPFPCYLRNNFLFIIEHVLPICLGISWVYSAATLVQSIVYEKEKRLKEVMRSMGLANSVHWLAWFITSYAQMTLTMTLLTVLLKAGEILAHSNPFVIWVMLEIFAASTITFAFLISTLYSKAKLAAACAGIIYLLSYVPFLFISIREESAHVIIPAWIKAIASLSSTTAFGLGAKYLAYYEMEGAGSQWHNLHYSPLEGDDFSLMHVLIMMVIDIIIYSSLVWYIEQVYPGEYGMPKPWYFPFVPSRWIEGGSGWCPERKANYVGSQDTDDDDILASSIRLRQPALPSESDPAHLPVGLEIDNLCKVYKKRSARKYAVDGLSLKLYQSQITAFLGHNGAGKTTTMNIITGLLSPTSGTARIYGQDIRSDMNQIRKSLGTCPQHNVLFDKLSVAEHLKFYARLKSLKQEDEIADELEQMVWNLGLPNKRDALVETLSGGMMRKLSVAIAFVGGSKTIILDEPTAGVDPHARRAIWDLILKYRKDRTVMLATHHMDEADIVGDRIAIIAQGRLRCVGSPLFLKARFGDGYRLTFVKTINSDADDASAVDVDSAVGLDFSAGLTPGAHSNSRSNGSTISGFASRCNAFELGKFLHAFGPTPRLAMQSLHEVHFQLPNWSGQQLLKLFTEMEREDFAGKYHVQSYGLQDSTLEEIFLKIVSNEESDTPPRDANSNKKRTRSARRPLLNIDDSGLDSGASNRSSFHADRGEGSPANSIHPAVDMTVPPFVPVVGWQLFGQQFAATFQKRFLCIRRNWKALFAQILLPALFVAVAMSVELPAVIMAPLPRMEMSPSQYYNFTQPKGNVIAYANHEHEDTIKRKRNDPTYVSGSSIAKTMYNPAGVGATCLLRYANESLVPTDAINMTDRDWVRETLLDRYFIPTCRRVFVEGLQLVNFVPPTYVFEDPSENSSVVLKPTPAPDRYYPLCECSKDGTGFSCQSGGYKSAENRRLVTGDNLYDITGQNESEYYLFTSDIYRLRRYGSLTFGLQLDKVPSDFGENAPVSLRKIAVRHISKVWYNNRGWHAMPIFLNTLNNAILRAALNGSKGNPGAYGITLFNHPMDGTNARISQEKILEGTDVLIAIFIVTAMSFVPASFVLFLVSERSTRSKHLQSMAGLSPLIYWTANFVWDILNYTVPAFCCCLILRLFNIPPYVSNSNFTAVVCLFLLYGWSMTPMMYPATFFFKEPSTAYIGMIVLNLFVGITCIMTSFLLQLFGIVSAPLSQIHSIVKLVFMIFPSFCLGRGLMDVAFNHYFNEYFLMTGQLDKIRDPFHWDIINRNLTAMAVIGFLSFGITLLLEFRRYRKVHSKMEGRGGTVEASVDVLLRNDDQDSDVRREIQRVHNSSRSESDIVRLEHLTKVYKSRKQGAQLAVDHLCIGVPNGECFGLLGVNGAGKTTTFRMLTGDLRPTRGDAFIASKSVQTDLANAQRRLGYCPQFDALFDELTAREHLTLYAKLRGVPPETVGEVVDWLLTRLDLMSYADKVSSTFSGGTKRKLSTAQALIGNPDLILLDEPTTGMDPRSRRFLWDVILGLTNAGKSIILTSHSMEECEVLCTRLAIMVNGRLRCLGSTQHLKNKYGDGYSLRLRLKADATNATKDAVCEYIQKHFCDATLKELHYGYMHYEVTSSVPLSRIFAAAERCMRDDLPIESYSISQNTLDNVFVGFVKFQGELAAADELERKAVSASQNRPFLHDDSVELTRLRRPGSESDIAAVYEGPRFDFNEDDDDN